jgi:hypothetical protein
MSSGTTLCSSNFARSVQKPSYKEAALQDKMIIKNVCVAAEQLLKAAESYNILYGSQEQRF